ncbi:hypothetical protein [Bacteriovorax sp. Seq25_V]|uniref:hypothetical protein n=1 Tax=Bacteriovorax sp. Seq25_V TaxID=1201288 RepID=UPI00038A5120|nr:hypothetical protein [Bacteriovorax sp. Seq25_V]EQC46342.1 putative lipoprotein [Bacteriovorax sp. Seq25_V]
MNKFSILLITLSLVSCVAPRDKRALYGDNEKSSSSSSSNGSSSSGSNGSAIEVDDGSGTTTGSSGSTIPAALQKCSWSLDGESGFATSSNTHLGAHTICQSTTDQSEVYVQLKTPLPSTRLCVIPTYTTSDRSIFLGEARCQFIESNLKLYRFPLVKNRDYGKYQNFQINSVMVMKEASYFFDSPFYRDQISYDAFFICSVNLDLYGDSRYCDAFKSKGEYVFKKF